MRVIDPHLAATGDLAEIEQRFAWNLPRRLNLGELTCRRHAADPARLALVCERATGERSEHTFAELDRRSDRVAHALAGLGVGRGDAVAVYLGQRLETALVDLAILKLGAVCLPLSPLLAPRRRRVPHDPGRGPGLRLRRGGA